MRLAPAALLCILACAQAESAFAQSADERVRELERVVQELERRIVALEAELAKPPENRTPRDRRNWRQLQRGMQAEEVEELLGAPDRVITRSFEVNWYYDPTGNVNFSPRMRVEGWREP